MDTFAHILTMGYVYNVYSQYVLTKFPNSYVSYGTFIVALLTYCNL